MPSIFSNHNAHRMWTHICKNNILDSLVALNERSLYPSSNADCLVRINREICLTREDRLYNLLHDPHTTRPSNTQYLINLSCRDFGVVNRLFEHSSNANIQIFGRRHQVLACHGESLPRKLQGGGLSIREFAFRCIHRLTPLRGLLVLYL